MSCNFHNLTGSHQGGVDPHTYYPLGAPPIIVPYAAQVFYFVFQPATVWKKAVRTTAEAWPMLQQGYDFYFILHIPIPAPPPDPAKQTEQTASVIMNSGSKLWMAVSSVTSGGTPLACCLKWMLSNNQNCADPMDAHANFVINLNSVQTSPTWGDYAGAAAASVVDALMAAAFGAIVDDLPLANFSKHLFRRAPDVIPEIEENTTKPVQQWVKQAVDGAS